MKKPKRSRDDSRGRSAGPLIIAALTDLAESLERGESLPPGAVAREVEGPADPGAYSPDAIRGARDRLAASREEFAGMLGVSPAMVQSLELGRREPSRLIRRMLDEFAREPDRWKRVADARSARARAAALATLEDLREQLAALAKREQLRDAITVRLDELREVIHGLDVPGPGATGGRR